jgi:hypothetical protein
VGFERAEKRDRTTEFVTREYNEEKYRPLLAMWKDSDQVTAPEIRAEEIGRDPESAVCISIGAELFRTTLREAGERFQALLWEHLGPRVSGGVGTIVELGCGWGYNLWRISERSPGPHLVGGEFSPRAVELGRSLSSGRENFRIEPFDFYESGYSIFDHVRGPAVVFTSHAVEQVADAERVIDSLMQRSHLIDCVYHFEPLPELYGDSLLGLMRRRYAELNDYNRNLLSTLRARTDIRLEVVGENVLGLNPLHPISIVRWSPA